MKKGLCFILALVMCLTLCACGNSVSKEQQDNEQTVQVSEEVKTVQRKIDKALESEPSYESLMEIRDLYESLLAKEQAQVENYDKLERLFQLNNEEVAGVFAINKLKGRLKNPSSLEVLSVNSITYIDTCMIKIDYTAENNVGGTKEGTYYCLVNAPTYDKNSNKWSCGLNSLFISKLSLEATSSLTQADLFKNESQRYAKEQYNKYDGSGKTTTLEPAKLMDNIDLHIIEVEDE